MMLTDDEIIKIRKDAPLLFDKPYAESLHFAREVIEANNAKVLADFKPVARFIYEHGHLTQVRLQNKDGIDLYSADTVSAIIQDRDALAARVQELESSREDAKLKKAIKDALEQAATAAWDAFGNNEARHAIRKLKDQL